MSGGICPDPSPQLDHFIVDSHVVSCLLTNATNTQGLSYAEQNSPM